MQSAQQITQHSGPEISSLEIAAHIVKDSRGLKKIAEVFKEALEVIQALTSNFSDNTIRLINTVRDSCQMIDIFLAIETAKKWICDKRSSWLDTLVLVNYTAAEIFGFTVLIEKTTDINLSQLIGGDKLAQKGSIIPFLSGAVCGFLLLGNVLDAVKHKRILEKIEQAPVKLEALKVTLHNCMAGKAVDEKKVRQIKNHIAKWQQVVEQASTFKLSVKVSIADNIVRVALSALMLIGIVFKVAMFAPASLLVMLLSLLSSGIGFYKIAIDKQVAFG